VGFHMGNIGRERNETMSNTTSMPSAKDIRSRLAISSIYLHQDGGPLNARRIAQIREAGITGIEIDGYLPKSHFDYRDKSQVSEIASECEKQGVKVVSMHCPPIPYGCDYEEVRRGVVKESVLSARVGEALGAELFIGHFGLGETAERTVSDILEQLDDCKIKLTIENGNDLNDFAAFVDKIASERLGMVVDIGHTRDSDKVNPFIKKDRARETIKVCGDRLFHVHLHDFTDADHYPPFDGVIEWGELFMGLQDIDYKGWYMFESTRSTPEDTLAKVAAFPDTFAERYC
jgi:sugar phosphate isomerase/epimerase